MSNKKKSLIYFACFAFSSLLYYQVEQSDKTEHQVVVSELDDIQKKELAKVNTETLEDF